MHIRQSRGICAARHYPGPVLSQAAASPDGPTGQSSRPSHVPDDPEDGRGQQLLSSSEYAAGLNQYGEGMLRLGNVEARLEGVAKQLGQNSEPAIESEWHAETLGRLYLPRGIINNCCNRVARSVDFVECRSS